jgi:ketosteroid isomerase-like protein
MESGVVPNEATEARAVVERFNDALARADLDSVLGTLADDVHWEAMGADFLPNGNVYESKDAVENTLFADAVALFDMSTWQLDATVVAADGAIVVVEWRVKAKTPRGHEYDNRYCVVFTVGAGRITDVREYTDTRYVANVLFAD